MLAADWQDEDGKPLHPVAYSVGGWHGPILPGRREDALPTLLAKLGPHAEPVEGALAALPVAGLPGLAVGTPIAAWSVTRTRDTSFAMI